MVKSLDCSSRDRGFSSHGYTINTNYSSVLWDTVSPVAHIISSMSYLPPPPAPFLLVYTRMEFWGCQLPRGKMKTTLWEVKNLLWVISRTSERSVWEENLHGDEKDHDNWSVQWETWGLFPVRWSPCLPNRKKAVTQKKSCVQNKGEAYAGYLFLMYISLKTTEIVFLWAIGGYKFWELWLGV